MWVLSFFIIERILVKIHLCALPQLMSSSIHFWVKVKWNVCSTQEKQIHVLYEIYISLFAILTSKQVVAAHLFFFLLRVRSRIHPSYASFKKNRAVMSPLLQKYFCYNCFTWKVAQIKIIFLFFTQQTSLEVTKLNFLGKHNMYLLIRFCKVYFLFSCLLGNCCLHMASETT